jgi:hypothetical protein
LELGKLRKGSDKSRRLNRLIRSKKGLNLMPPRTRIRE